MPKPKLKTSIVLCMILVSWKAFAGEVERPKLALHVTPPPAKISSVCGPMRAPHPPCNLGSSTLTVHGQIEQPYTVYVLIVDGPPVPGVLGASFGISYGPHLALSSWFTCADGIESRFGSWPASGTGNVLTWNTCQNTPAPGDLDNGVTAVLGAFYTWAYADDALQITPHPASGEYSISVCTTSATMKMDPAKTPRAGFGAQSGFDPCIGGLSPYSYFQNLPSGDLSSVSIKLTAVAVGRASVVFSPQTVDMSKFIPFHRDGYTYHGDVDPNRISISPAEAGAVINNVGSLPQVTNGGVVRGFVSFSLLSTVGNQASCFEAILRGPEARAVIDIMNSAFGSNSAAKDAVWQFACSEFLTNGSDLPADVSTSVSITFSGFEFDHASKLYVTTMRVKNIGSSLIQGPLSIVIHTSGAVLQGPDGRTCAIEPAGYPYITLPSNISPGASVERQVRFSNLADEVVEIVDSKAFSGVGVR